MVFFDKLKKSVDWNDSYNVAPKFYRKPDGSLFGAIALTEDTKTALPKKSHLEYKVDGKLILVLVSTSKETIIGDSDYFAALKIIEQYEYSLDANKSAILVKELSLEELESVRSWRHL